MSQEPAGNVPVHGSGRILGVDIRQSPLVQAATQAVRPSRWWVAIIAVIVMLVIAYLVASEPAGLIVDPDEGTLSEFFVEVLAFPATLILLLLWVRFKERRPARSIGFIGSGGLRRFGTGLALGAFMMGLVTLIAVGLDQYDQVDNPAGATAGWAALIPVVLLLAVWAVQSSTEEALTRGYLLQVCGLQIPAWIALLTPGILFVALHLTNAGGAQPLVMVNLLFFALFMAFMALGQGSIWMACGWHAAWNWTQGSVLGLPVSGVVLNDPSIITFAQSSDATNVLSGGEFGIEGSLVSTFILGLATAVAFYYMHRQLTISSSPRLHADTVSEATPVE